MPTSTYEELLARVAKLDTGVALESEATRLRFPRARRRILIIEDNIDATESLREALELGDHEVAIAHDGPEGLAKARIFQPEVVLCDIGLPGMDGFDVARAFRADERLRGAFVVALSGYHWPRTCSAHRKPGSSDTWRSRPACRSWSRFWPSAATSGERHGRGSA